MSLSSVRESLQKNAIDKPYLCVEVRDCYKTTVSRDWERFGFRKYDSSEDEDDSLLSSEDENELAHRSAPMYQVCVGKFQAPETPRQRLFEDLVNALWTPSDETKPSLGTFAACETVKHSEGFILPSFHVEGAGELRLPLSTEDTAKLSRVRTRAIRQRLSNSCGHSCAPLLASGWGKVTFPGAPEFLSENLQRLATKAVASLGLVGEGAQLEAHLYKLLSYTPGGHFSFHRDTEKEKGMFATLILPLPTEEGYTGGKLVVKHYNKTKNFDAHMVSTLGFSYTVFFAD